MGCGLSKQDEEDDVVSVCRERKRLLKLAVERRYAFADAQCNYNNSLFAVAMAIRLFVSRHSSPSPFLITFPSSSDSGHNHDKITDHNHGKIISQQQLFLQQRPTEPKHEASSCQSESESESEDGEGVCEHFYEDHEVGPQMASSPAPRGDCGWDFFNPFDDHDEVRAEVVRGFSQSFDEDLRAVRVKEGIPELEQESEVVMNVKNTDLGHKKSGITDKSNGEGKELRAIDGPENERELLEALKDVVDHFAKAYDSGMDISRMLEANRVQLQSGLEEIKENSNKLIRSTTWNRTTSSRSSSCKSLITSSPISSSAWTESKNDLFEDYGMEAGSHSLTLGRLYAWEKKLYHQVKAGEEIRKAYVRKCLHLQNYDPDAPSSKDKARAEVKDLQSGIAVAIRSAESISDRIQKLTDDELHPQLLELLHSLTRNWKIMLESHETQNRVMLEVKSFNCPLYGKLYNDSHRLATLQLEADLNNWRNCFDAYLSTQKAYVEALSGWLSMFMAPEAEFYYRGKSSIPPLISGPPLLITCRDWLACLGKLPDHAVSCAMKSFGKEIHALWSQQGEEQQQKRKVDELAKGLERKALSFQKTERRILEFRVSDQELKANVRDRVEYLAERKNQLDMFKKRLEAEKEKHLIDMQETQRITLNGLQLGFSSVFYSLAEFSKASVNMYADLVTYSANAKTATQKDGNQSNGFSGS